MNTFTPNVWGDMKTKEQWLTISKGLPPDDASIGVLIERIQLDAYCSGMTKAAEIAQENGFDWVPKVILSHRDSLTQLPPC